MNLKESDFSFTTHDAKHFPTIFLSDIHLGTPVCRAERLLSFLKSHTCENLFLVGDIVDGWRLKSNFYWPETHSEVVQTIMEMAKDGTNVIYVTGNHDEFLRKYTDLHLGNLRISDEAEHTTSAGRRLLIVHGDQFDIVTRYHRWVALLGDISYHVLVRLNLWLNSWRERFGYGYWSLADWAKRKVKRAVNFIGHFEDAVAHECKRRGFDGIVCGHIHHAEKTIIQGTEYYNCGDWVESCTALVEDNEGQLHILPWQQPRADIMPLTPKIAVGE